MVLSKKFSLGTESVVQFIARANQGINHFLAIKYENQLPTNNIYTSTSF